ncbi:DUF192 domain-containing protein [Ignatzschineria sp. LJL83]
MRAVYRILNAGFLILGMFVFTNIQANPMITNPDLEKFQQEKQGLVKMSFGFSPNSGLREGEMVILDVPISVELALDSASQARGLMYRQEMPENSGMLFMFSEETPLSFWMKNTLIPLDIIYINEQGNVVHIATAQPCKIQNCPSYPSVYPAKYVLELNAGRAEELGLSAGDNLNWAWK